MKRLWTTFTKLTIHCDLPCRGNNRNKFVRKLKPSKWIQEMSRLNKTAERWEPPLDQNLETFGKHCATFFNSLSLWFFLCHQQCCKTFIIPNVFFVACRLFQSTLTGLLNRGFHKLCSKFLRFVIRLFRRPNPLTTHSTLSKALSCCLF